MYLKLKPTSISIVVYIRLQTISSGNLNRRFISCNLDRYCY